LFADAGTLEIDDTAKIIGVLGNEGVYVQAWVWIPKEEINRKTIKEKA